MSQQDAKEGYEVSGRMEEIRGRRSVCKVDVVELCEEMTL